MNFEGIPQGVNRPKQEIKKASVPSTEKVAKRSVLGRAVKGFSALMGGAALFGVVHQSEAKPEATTIPSDESAMIEPRTTDAENVRVKMMDRSSADRASLERVTASDSALVEPESLPKTPEQLQQEQSDRRQNLKNYLQEIHPDWKVDINDDPDLIVVDRGVPPLTYIGASLGEGKGYEIAQGSFVDDNIKFSNVEDIDTVLKQRDAFAEMHREVLAATKDMPGVEKSKLIDLSIQLAEQRGLAIDDELVSKRMRQAIEEEIKGEGSVEDGGVDEPDAGVAEEEEQEP